MILQSMGANPTGSKTYNNRVSFGGNSFNIGFVTGTVLN